MCEIILRTYPSYHIRQFPFLRHIHSTIHSLFLLWELRFAIVRAYFLKFKTSSIFEKRLKVNIYKEIESL